MPRLAICLLTEVGGAQGRQAGRQKRNLAVRHGGLKPGAAAADLLLSGLRLAARNAPVHLFVTASFACETVRRSFAVGVPRAPHHRDPRAMPESGLAPAQPC